MDIYSLLREIVSSDEKRLYNIKFKEGQVDVLEEETDKKIFILLCNISSLGVNFETTEIKFSPMIEYPDGTRTFALEDLSDDDFQLLYSLEFDKLPLILRARISIVLWVKKKDYKMALKASACYHELYLTFFDSEKWGACYKFLVISVKLASQINSKDYPTYLQGIADKIIELNGEDTSILLTWRLNNRKTHYQKARECGRIRE